MNIVFFFIITIFFDNHAMQIANANSLSQMLLPAPLIEQITLYIADVSKDANETVQSLIKLGRVNKYFNTLIKQCFTEESSQHTVLYEKLFEKEGWQTSKPSVFVLFGMKAIEQKKKCNKNGDEDDWTLFNIECFEYAVHGNKTDIVLKCPKKPLPSSLCTYYKTGTPLLQIAIEKNNPQAVKQLLDLKVNPKVGIIELDAHNNRVMMDLLKFAKQKKSNQEIITMLDEALNPKDGVAVSMGEISLR